LGWKKAEESSREAFEEENGEVHLKIQIFSHARVPSSSSLKACAKSANAEHWILQYFITPANILIEQLLPLHRSHYCNHPHSCIVT
jgi:hypothetical protein